MYINDMKKRFIQSLILALVPLCLFFCLNKIAVADALTTQLKGRILLQVQGHGEAWYVSPDNGERYYMGRPADAFNLMRTLGIGVSNVDFIKFNGVAPKALAGKILLKVQDKGQAYYVNPTDLKLYYLGRPADAFAVMRKLGLGITNTNLEKLTAHATHNLIGGQQDEHGCLGPAGYSWCPSTNKCQRMWEEYCTEFKDQYRDQTNNATSSQSIATTTDSNLPTATSTENVATSTDTATSTTPAIANKFLAEYFQNSSVLGSPLFSDYTDAINYDWAKGGPSGLGRKTNFSIRWTGSWQFDEGKYIFHADFDDGMNVYIDGALVITSWRQGSQEKVIDKSVTMTPGWHEIKAEYYKLDNIGIAKLNWTKTQ
jgi:hypothetical protein